jgi:hypothetical protein
MGDMRFWSHNVGLQELRRAYTRGLIDGNGLRMVRTRRQRPAALKSGFLAAQMNAKTAALKGTDWR